MNDNKTKLHERRLLHLFMVLNVGLAAAFAVYVVISRNNQPKVVPASFSTTAPPKSGRSAKPTHAPRATQIIASKPSIPGKDPMTAAAGPSTEAEPATAEAKTALAPSAPAAPPARSITSSPRKFTWREVESPDYPGYVENLRRVGCPEEKLRQIVLADVNELFDQRRREISIASDTPWWRAQPEYMLSYTLQQKGRLLEEQRRSLITFLLGPEALDVEKDRPAPWSHVALTGAVLGAMPAEKHALVQEICAKALERQGAVRGGQLGGIAPASPIEAARSREQTRADLRQVLDANELEEFLLRYSHVAHNLRYELSAVNPTETEFRGVFRAVDPIEHQMQLEFGSVATMSQQQRERYERQREQAIREALGSDRYKDYVVAKDPLYQVAQAMAQQRNAPPEVLMPIYQLTKATEARRQKILSDTTLTPAQRTDALNAVNREQAESIQKIVAGALRNR